MPYDEYAYQTSEDCQEKQFFERMSEADVVALFEKFLDFMEQEFKIKCPSE